MASLETLVACSMSSRHAVDARMWAWKSSQPTKVFPVMEAQSREPALPSREARICLPMAKVSRLEAFFFRRRFRSVSYTHLTLPTIYSV